MSKTTTSKRLNILVFNPKGGAAKSTTSNIIASFYNNSVLYEIDKINESEQQINCRTYYHSKQVDFLNERDERWQDFILDLEERGTKIVDIGAVMLERFHNTLVDTNNYELFDLIVIPSMDGADDFKQSVNFINSIYKIIDVNKIIFGFNKYNSLAYSVKEQFDSFFENFELLKKNFNIDLVSNYFVLEDSYAVKKSRKNGETLRFYIEKDIKAEKIKSRDIEISREERSRLAKELILIQNCQKFYTKSILPMLNLIKSKTK